MAPARKRKSTRSQDAETSRKLSRTSTSGTTSRSKAKAEPAEGDDSTAAIPISTAELIATTRKVLASIDPHASPFHPRHRPDDHKLEGGDAETKEEIIQSSLSLAAFKAEMLAKSSSSDQTTRSNRRRSSSGAPVELDLKGITAEIDWQMYRDWPEGIAEEEAAMKTYFQRLKFIYLEQATKLTFLNDCREDLENGKEGVVHSQATLKALEESAVHAKGELKAAKEKVRGIRNEIDQLADGMMDPYEELEKQNEEAKAYIAEIRDMELELAKIRAMTGASGTEYDVDSTVPPKLGTMTLEEAEAFNEKQLLLMQDLQESTTAAQAATKEKQKELTSTMRAVERLTVERKREEKYAEEVGQDGGRDLEVEKLCENHSATLQLLKTALGIEAIEASSETELRLTFLPSSSSGSKEPIKLVCQYDVPGGKLLSYAIVRPDDTDADLPEDNLPLLDAAFAANDVPQLIQELWRALAVPAAA